MDGYRGEFLKTLRLVPDDVILSLGTRDIDLGSPSHCVIGWIARELRGREQEAPAEDTSAVNGYGYPESMLDTVHRRLRGDRNEWQMINGAFGDYAAADALEDAFIDRLEECVA